MRYTPETYLTMKIRACNYTPVCDVDHQENIIDYEITTVVEKSAQGIEISANGVSYSLHFLEDSSLRIANQNGASSVSARHTAIPGGAGVTIIDPPSTISYNGA